MGQGAPLRDISFGAWHYRRDPPEICSERHKLGSTMGRDTQRLFVPLETNLDSFFPLCTLQVSQPHRTMQVAEDACTHLEDELLCE